MQGYKKVYYAIFIAIVLVCGIIYIILQNNQETQAIMSEVEETSQPTTEATTQSYIYVQICGAIEKEGVYKVIAGTRVFELIEQAGGLTPDAAIEAVNQAREVKDGEQIFFPTRNEVTAGTFQKETSTQLININCASKDELMKLPGIGETRALSIIQYRDKNNGFQCIEDIMKVDGIKTAMFEKIKALITV